MLANVARPCSIAATMVAKWSSSRTRSAASRATSVPERAHGDADVGLAQRRGVVHAVAGHRDDVASAAQGAGDAQLVLRRHPGDDDAVVVERLAERGVVGGQVGGRSSDEAVVGPGSPTCSGDGRAVAG